MREEILTALKKNILQHHQLKVNLNRSLLQDRQQIYTINKTKTKKKVRFMEPSDHEKVNFYKIKDETFMMSCSSC